MKCGTSASRPAPVPIFLSEAAPTLPAGRGIGDYRELVLAQDLSFAWHHLQLWAEFYEARFEVPRIGNADTFAYYLEAKYKITPQLFGALRWNQQLFGTIRDEDGRAKWGNDIWRIDAALGYRFTDYLQGKLQYSFSDQNSPPGRRTPRCCPADPKVLGERRPIFQATESESEARFFYFLENRQNQPSDAQLLK